MNTFFLKKTLFRILLIGSVFITLSMQVIAATKNYAVPGYVYVTTQGVLTVPALDPNSLIVVEITGKLGGKSMGNVIDFTAINLGGNSFLAQADSGIYKKGVFFEIDSDGKVKATAARYCLLTECQNRNLALTDKDIGDIATDPIDYGYGIFYVRITGSTNLALHQAATQSSLYAGESPASNAVDGSTNGYWSNYSVSSTRKENNAWWQVDLGGDELIKQIHIFNRTDACCKDRLTHYRVTIFGSHFNTYPIYQQDFHTYPNPKQILDLGIQSIEGRYVRIQLLGNNFLSLAEVQVF